MDDGRLLLLGGLLLLSRLLLLGRLLLLLLLLLGRLLLVAGGSGSFRLGLLLSGGGATSGVLGGRRSSSRLGGGRAVLALRLSTAPGASLSTGSNCARHGSVVGRAGDGLYIVSGNYTSHGNSGEKSKESEGVEGDHCVCE